jgi:hypothetical protein
MEHLLHLSAKHFVQAIALSLPQQIAKKIKSTLQHAEINGEVNVDILDAELDRFSFNDGDESEGEGNTTDLDVGDSLGKALALVSQVRSYLF